MLNSKSEYNNYKKYLYSSKDFKQLASVYLYPLKLAVYNLKKQLKPKTSKSTIDNSPITLPKLNYKAIADNCKKYYVDFSLAPNYSDLIRLSGAKTIAAQSTNIPDNDIQDLHAYNRLYWLIDINISVKQDRLVSWLSSDFKQHPYDASERIMVLIWFLAYHKSIDDKLQEQCINRLYLDTIYLSNNIEHHLGVHNHVLNNCRALIAAVNVLELDELSSIATKARATMDKYWDKLILEDGFFNEQSTSYHLLLTRTFIEYVYDKKLNGIELTDKLKKKGVKMATITNNLFNSNGSYPLIGDITPDFPSSYFKGLTHACYNAGLLNNNPAEKETGFALGVNNLFENKVITSASSDNITELYKDSGLLIVNNNGLKLVAMLSTTNKVLGHGDAGSIGGYELFYNNQPVVVDGGLPHYTFGAEFLKYKSAEANNVISMNNIDAAVNYYDAPTLPKNYLSKGSNTLKQDTNSVSFTCLGFSRTGIETIWERVINWADNKITVTDQVTANKSALVTNRVTTINNELINIEFSDDVTKNETTIAREYGLTSLATQIINSKTTNNYNFTATYTPQ